MKKDFKNLLYREICSKIRGVRMEMNLTQEEFADNLNISRSSIVNIEKNRQRPTIHLLYDISVMCGVKMDYFFDSLPIKDGDQPISKKIEKKIKGKLDDKTKAKVEEFISKLPPKE